MPPRDSRFLRLAPPAGAMYAFPGVDTQVLPDFDDQQFALDLLEQKHVLVAPGVSFNVPYRNHFRITNLPDAATLREVFARIEELLAAMPPRDPTSAARPKRAGKVDQRSLQVISGERDSNRLICLGCHPI